MIIVVIKIMEEYYVSFEIAKMLKEKGFDEHCSHDYLNNWGMKSCILDDLSNSKPRNTDLKEYSGAHWEYISAPTHQMAMD